MSMTRTERHGVCETTSMVASRRRLRVALPAGRTRPSVVSTS